MKRRAQHRLYTIIGNRVLNNFPLRCYTLLNFPYSNNHNRILVNAVVTRTLHAWKNITTSRNYKPSFSLNSIPTHLEPPTTTTTLNNIHIDNNNSLAILLKEWNEKGRYEDVLKRCSTVLTTNSLETCDTHILREFFKALVTASNNDNHNLKSSSSDSQNHFLKLLKTFKTRERRVESSSDCPSTNLQEFHLKLDDSAKPIQVSIKEFTKTNSMLRDIIKYGLTALLTIAAISVMVEGAAASVPRGLGLGGGKKVQAVTNLTTCFKDVKGCDEVKDELQEIVSYLTDPEKFTRLGAKLPKGILLCGSPGTGKTLLARAVAGEAKVPFLQASGSEFEEMFVGVGARRIRELFATARRMAPAIVFIDEIDAVGSRRVNKENTSVRMTLNQLLVELDGFEQTDGVVVICATNFPESLDVALTRPGRLDKTVVVPLPDLQGRQEILNLYGSRVKLDQSVDLSVLARRTAGMTGADLFNIINIAAVKSSVDGKSSISMDALETAFDRVVVGLERRNPMSENEKRMTAYHEAGHALVSWHTKLADPVHKVTIMPRGESLGITWQIPTGDRYQEKACELKARLAVLMGGKASEVVTYGCNNVTAGCTADLKSATLLAREMVTHFGMGMDTTEVPMFIDTHSKLSEKTRQNIDLAVQKLLDTAYTHAVKLLSEHREELEQLANALIEFETISFEEMKMVLEGNAEGIPLARQAARQRLNKSEQQQLQQSPLNTSKVATKIFNRLNSNPKQTSST